MTRKNKIIIATLFTIIIAVLFTIIMACVVSFVFATNYGHPVLALISGIVGVIFFVFTYLLVMAIAENN